MGIYIRGCLFSYPPPPPHVLSKLHANGAGVVGPEFVVGQVQSRYQGQLVAEGQGTCQHDGMCPKPVLLNMTAAQGNARAWLGHCGVLLAQLTMRYLCVTALPASAMVPSTTQLSPLIASSSVNSAERSGTSLAISWMPLHCLMLNCHALLL